MSLAFLALCFLIHCDQLPQGPVALISPTMMGWTLNCELSKLFLLWLASIKVFFITIGRESEMLENHSARLAAKLSYFPKTHLTPDDMMLTYFNGHAPR